MLKKTNRYLNDQLLSSGVVKKEPSDMPGVSEPPSFQPIETGILILHTEVNTRKYSHIL